MKMFNELGALVLWGLALLMASTLNLPVAMAEEEKSAPEDFRVLSDEDPKEPVEPYLSEPSINYLRDHVSKIQSMTPDELAEFRIDYFDLFVNCEPVYVVIEDLSADAHRIGLTKQAVVAAVESRLRAARIYTDKRNTPYLHVVVNVLGTGHSIEIELHKWLFDNTISMRSGTATTWQKSALGAHTDASFILAGVSQLMDLFIADYLRINEIACKYKEK